MCRPSESIPEEEPEESLYTEMGELKLLSQLELEERRSRKGSSNEGSHHSREGSHHSRTSSTSGPHSTSISSEDGCEVSPGFCHIETRTSLFKPCIIFISNYSTTIMTKNSITINSLDSLLIRIQNVASQMTGNILPSR